MGSGAVIYILSFTKIGTGIKKFMGDRETQTAWLSHSFFIFLNKKKWAKMTSYHTSSLQRRQEVTPSRLPLQVQFGNIYTNGVHIFCKYIP
jgi:hypothetical protein